MKSAQWMKVLLKEVKPVKKNAGALYSELCQLFPLRRIESRTDYKAALRLITSLSEKMVKDGEVKTHREVLLYADTLGLLIEHYEKSKYPDLGKKVSAAEMLTFLMEQNYLNQTDLADDLGGQSVVSDILSGKRNLNTEQIRTLSKRFHISPAVFFGS